MSKLFLNQDIIRCNKTLKLQNTIVIQRGILYVARQVKPSCCQIMIDTGYRHHTPIVHTCSCCGKISSPSVKLFIPQQYFTKTRQKQDALTKTIQHLEHHFSLIEHRIAMMGPIQ